MNNGKNTTIQCNLNDKMKDIFNKFGRKVNKDINLLYFLYGGKILNEELTLEENINKDDINKINIIVNDINKEEEKENIIKSKEIICPICKECIKMNIYNYRIYLNECKNKHRIDNIFIKEFENKQNINQNEIICDICKINNKGKAPNNEFYFCNTCKIKICTLCKSSHNMEHNIINYQQKDYICEIHNEIYIKYCTTCKKNICLSCHKMHKEHAKIPYEDIIPDMYEVINTFHKLKNSMDIFKNDFKKIINELNIVIENLDIYYIICKNLINIYESKNRNYETLQNINEINNNNNNIINDINNINNDNNILNKLKEILNIYKKMKNYESAEINEIRSETKLNLRKIKKK